MKIVSFNTNGAFRNKYEKLTFFEWDILVIQECEDPSQSKDLTYREWASNYLWVGGNKHKGLGVFGRKGIKLERLRWQARGDRYFLPCRVNDDFNLLAVWCHLDQSQPKYNYSGQFWKYLQRHRKKLGKCILAGDFNAHPQFDKPSRTWNFSDSLRILDKLGIISTYHTFFGESHGAESQPTLFLLKQIGRPFHLDYIFVSRHFKVKQCTVGESKVWLPTSDHMPVFAKLD